MYVAGFTFVRNIIQYAYPVKQSILSALPLCDVFFVSVGDSTDATLQLIRSLPSPKIRILHSTWDESLGEKVLAQETDKVLDIIYNSEEEFDYLLYLQADEVLHEKDYLTIKQMMCQYLQNDKVEGFLFSYYHFYGSYAYLGSGREWYRNEIRIIKNRLNIRSYRDAQGFRRAGKKLKVVGIPAAIYHYGWVKNPVKQLEKRLSFESLYGVDKDQLKASITGKAGGYNYEHLHSVTRFQGTHPYVMQEIVTQQDWNFVPTDKKCFKNIAHRLLYYVEKYTGKRFFEYKNYLKIEP